MISVREIFKGSGLVSGDNLSNDAQIEANSYKSGSSLLSSYRATAKALSFKGFVTPTLTQYNRVLGQLQKAVYLAHSDEQLKGYQPIAITSMGIEWQEGGFLRGGVFTLELILLSPYFESFDEHSSNGGLESPTNSFDKELFTVYNPSPLASSFVMVIEATEPNRSLSLSLANKESNLTFTDLTGFGTFYNKIRLDIAKNSFEIVTDDHSNQDLSAYLTADSGFFLLEPGENQLELVSADKVKIHQFFVRSRWYI